MALHTTPDLAEIEVVAGLYFAAKKQHLDRLVQEDAHVENPAGIDHRPFKIFIGHAGWGPGQLEQELDEGAWQALPAALDLRLRPRRRSLGAALRRDPLAPGRSPENQAHPRRSAGELMKRG